MKIKILVSTALLLGLGIQSSLFAASPREEAINKGYEHYKIFCINCHGKKADGKGPLAASLKIAPADLTLLKQSDPDTCIAERVLKAVSGVHDSVPGQKANMPTFSGNLESITIYELVQFLKAIQK
ncbi:c-type cytochrome [Thiolapillus brandeum]|uniref:Cytochrome c family protein n=1 Tax=Thiolapillus brandeum TaxID=1076588 RepID=A0A7U6GK42_9GAMM|nr:cytochrome c [Thiolapillus brandeum]BAO45065.1 cytochrome c family protein [Thiolapillus brandeum]